MARPFTLSLCMLLLAGACFAFNPRTINFNRCQLDRLNALEPDHRVESEGGLIETFNSQHPELQCAGVTVCKRTLFRHGLHLASYSPYPQLILVNQGEGAVGFAFPGCPETFEEAAQESRKQVRQQHVEDSHQKIHRFTQGDLLFIPPGVPYWTYNTGEDPLIAVSLLYTSSIHNQLDQSPRAFYLGGNPGIEHPETVKKQSQQEKGDGGNVLSGFSKHFLAQSFNIDEDLAEKLQLVDDERKQIVKVKGGLSIISPKWQEQEEEEEKGEEKGEEEEKGEKKGEEKEEEEEKGEEKEEEGVKRWKKKTKPCKPEEKEVEEWKTKHSHKKEHGNGIDESICSVKLHESISRSSRADFYNPKAGRISTLNSLTFPALAPFGISAQYVVLYKNGIYSPHWNQNANSVMYVVRGHGKVTVVNCTGDAVFDGVLKRGQLLVVPQNFAVAEEASEQGFEYVVFKTHEIASTSYLKEVFRAMPEEVLANTYNLRQSQVRELKYQGNWGPLVNPDSQ